MQGTTRHASWKELLAPSVPGAHYLQIYDSDEFLATAVAHFAAEGLRRGEAVLLTPTAEHLSRIRRQLGAQGADVESALRCGQLTEIDAERAVQSVLKDGMPDPALFDGLAGAILAKVRADARFAGVRWWGEMTGVLSRGGNPKAGLAAEDLGDALVKKHGVMLFCSHACDRFCAPSYDELRDVCCKHSHVIPAEDYAWHRQVVNRAIAEVLGPIHGSALQSLVSWQGPSCDMPSSQALLFWLRDAMPEHFDAILARARAYHDSRRGRERLA
jgi:hypothetical protein